jgi:hypothetical protein
MAQVTCNPSLQGTSSSTEMRSTEFLTFIPTNRAEWYRLGPAGAKQLGGILVAPIYLIQFRSRGRKGRRSQITNIANPLPASHTGLKTCVTLRCHPSRRIGKLPPSQFGTTNSGTASFLRLSTNLLSCTILEVGTMRIFLYEISRQCASGAPDVFKFAKHREVTITNESFEGPRRHARRFWTGSGAKNGRHFDD